MTYRTPESIIRQIMAESHAPALRIPEPDRVADALKVLQANGVSAKKHDDKTISIENGDVEKAYTILDNAIFHGMIQAKPLIQSSNAIPVDDHVQPAQAATEPTPPEGGHKIGEETDPKKEENDKLMNIPLERRTLVNRMENQLKKIDESFEGNDAVIDDLIREMTNEELELLDELSKKTLGRYVNSAHANAIDHAHTEMDAYHKSSNLTKDLMKHTRDDAQKAGLQDMKQDASEKHRTKRDKGIRMAVSKLVGRGRINASEEVEQLDELGYGKLNAYVRAGREALKSDKMDGRIERRKKGLEMAKTKKIKMVSKAAFGEEVVQPVDTLLRVRTAIRLDEAKGLRLVATHNSECGKHCAKVYKDHEWGEHRVKYFINGTHHEPADSHHGDVQDAHDTAQAEMKRMTKLNGALKEATEEDINELMEDYEQIDELSKNLIKRYYDKAEAQTDDVIYSRDMHDHEPEDAHIMGVKNPSDKEVNKAIKRSRNMRTAENKLHGKAKVNATAYSSKNNVVRPQFGKNNVKEAAENGNVPFQIAEISHKTVWEYGKKAVQDKKSKEKVRDDSIKSAHREYHSTFGDAQTTNIYRQQANDAQKGVDKRNRGLKLAAKRLITNKSNKVNEEETQIDELSNHTLARYANKAKVDIAKKTNARDFDGAAKRARNVTKAEDKITNRLLNKEEVQIDELSANTMTNYAIKAPGKIKSELKKSQDHMGIANKLEREGNDFGKYMSHRNKEAEHGIRGYTHSKALKKVGNKIAAKAMPAGVHESEQIDELSKNKLVDYVRSASRDMADTARKSGVEIGQGKRGSEYHQKTLKRFKGVMNATRRLREETLSEGKKDDLAKAQKLFSKHTHADAMHRTIIRASQNHNYVQDAMDNVYSNHQRDLKYEDWHNMKPHIEDMLKQRGLQ